jgi:hypothetical protein
LVAAAVVGVGAPPAAAVPSQTASWNGNGVSIDAEGDVSLDSEVCGTENGAPVDGTYLKWVLVAKKVGSATLTIGSDAPAVMTRHGNNGTFQYLQTDFEDLDDVLDAGASASYVGTADPKAKVVLGGGCLDAGVITLTAVSAFGFGVYSLGLTEAECNTATFTGPAIRGYQPATIDFPSLCVVVQPSPPTTTDTIVMPINRDAVVTDPDVGLSFNAAVIRLDGVFAPNPACTITGDDDNVMACLVTSSTTVTVQAPPV